MRFPLQGAQRHPDRGDRAPVDSVEQDVRKITGPEICTIDDNLGGSALYNLGFVPSENAAGQDAGKSPSSSSPTIIRSSATKTAFDGDRTQLPGSTLYFEQADVSQVLYSGMPSQVDVEVEARDFTQAIPALKLERELQVNPRRRRRAPVRRIGSPFAAPRHGPRTFDGASGSLPRTSRAASSPHSPRARSPSPTWPRSEEPRQLQRGQGRITTWKTWRR